MTKPINELFAQFEKIRFDRQMRYEIFLACAKDVKIESADIPKLLSYFDTNNILRVLTMIEISTISSSMLIKILSNYSDSNYKYDIFQYLIKYVSVFDSLEHKTKIIKIFKYDVQHVDSVVSLIKDIKIVENYEQNSLSPPPYEKFSEQYHVSTEKQKCDCVLL
jgi:hypothetical protein